MRYQQYKNKMLKIRKVLNFFFHLRFVFLGITVAIIATCVSLDVSKGAITETSKFEISYRYGEPISYSGSSFMGVVTYEFRRANTNDEWSEEQPKYVGMYEARAKSLGNHGYYYSDVSTFEITPYEVPISINATNIDFGNHKPALKCDLLGSDHLAEEYYVNYADETKNTTTALLDLNSIKVYDKDNVDVTDCYSFTTEEKEITFRKQNIIVEFVKPEAIAYDGEEHGCDEIASVSSDNLYPEGAHPVVHDGQKWSSLGVHDNEHSITIEDNEGTDYTENYNIVVKDNSIVINKLPAISITSSTPEAKVYDGKPFSDDCFTYEIDGLLPIHHEVVTFNHKEDFFEAGTASNSFSVDILDEKGNDASGFYSGINTHAGTLTINKRVVTITSSDLPDQIFNNEAKKNEDFTYDANEFAEGDKPVRITTTSATDPGVTPNTQTYDIVHVDPDTLEETSVKDNYVINPVEGNITINKLPLKFKFVGKPSQMYDGASYNVFDNNNLAIPADATTEENLAAQGLTYNVAVKNSDNTDVKMKDYKEGGYTADESMVKITLMAGDRNVTSLYTIDNDPDHSNDAECDVTFEFGTSQIEKRDVTIEFSDYGEKIYDDESFEETTNIADLYTVSGSGIATSYDELVVEYEDESQKDIKDVGEHTINFEYKIQNKSSKQNVNSNYDITVVSDKLDSAFNIKKKKITIHTPGGLEKVYDDTNEMPKVEFCGDDFEITGLGEDLPDDYPLTKDDIKVVCNKQPLSPSANVGTHTYPFDVKDLSIVINNNDVTKDFTIELIADGQIEIKKRPIEISQTEGSKEFIYFDNEEHGVHNGPNSEVVVQKEGKDCGLLTSQGHSIFFEKKRIRKDEGKSTFPNGEPASNAYYGTHIYKEVQEIGIVDVVDNYAIDYVEPFVIKIVKKTIHIYSGSGTKIFDGDPLDIYAGYEPTRDDGYFDIDTFKGKKYGNNNLFTYTVSSEYETNAQLNDKDHLFVTKTKESILNNTVHNGTYVNDYDYKVLRIDGNTETDVTDYYYYDVVDKGELTVSPLTIDTYCDKYKKEYDGNSIFYVPSAGTYDVDDVPTARAILPSDKLLDKDKFNENFTVKVTFGSHSYGSNVFMANEDEEHQYEFGASFTLYDERNHTDYTYPGDVIFTRYSAKYTYYVSKVDITIISRNMGAGREMRYYSGKLVKNDYLWFGDYEWDPIYGKRKFDWAGNEFTLGNIHIKKKISEGNYIDVTDCYNRTLQVL